MLVIAGGCGKPPAPVSSKVFLKPYPSWYNNPKSNDAIFMYATGNAETKDEAVRNALSNMIGTLGISIESSFESKLQVKSSYATREVESNIKTSISKIRINNYEVLFVEKIRYNETVVMIRSNKANFAKGLKSFIDKELNDIQRNEASLNSANNLKSYNTYFDLDIKAKALLPSILVASAVDKSFKEGLYLEKISKIKENFLSIKSTLIFYVYGDKNSKQFITKIKNFLSEKGLALSASKTKKSINLSINTDTRITTAGYNIKIGIFSVDIKAFAKNKSIGGKVLILKERYTNSMQTAYKNAAIHLEEEMKNKNFKEIIGLEIR
ncbi:LPP20 family lipoprotein [Sulfurimonas sp. MAG313]|nr:LPP20 family lipoprotein [Sulfurimonas sp. MAG313]MDF1881081.1 LPP20 family lipoprotein [Sulfurimonas sp. MAG313]